MILYIREHKNSARKHLESIYKIFKYVILNLLVGINSFFIHKEQKYRGKKSLTDLHVTIASKTIKYLGINLTKDVNNLYSENFKFEKEVEKG